MPHSPTPKESSDPIEAGPDLAVIVPTLNERDNVDEFVRRLASALSGLRWEVVFVDDDSPDGTSHHLRELAQLDRRVRVMQRIGRRGLASATIEGMLASSAPYLAVMDADMQHDERLLPRMLDAVRSGDYDVVVGSRYITGGSGGGVSVERQRASLLATRLARTVLRTELRDPMSGFFVVGQATLQQVAWRLSGIGYKILLDILASSSAPLRVLELPYVFRPRVAGESKLDSLVAWEYLMMLLDKKAGRYIPVRFLLFALVGASGVIVHMLVLWGLFMLLGVDFGAAQALATLTAMTSNFLLNNAFTYRDRQLRKGRLLRGWFTFVAACSVGAVANVGIATYLYTGAQAHWFWAALAGTFVGAVWNYAVTWVYTWGSPNRSRPAPATRAAGSN
ncbi:MAG: glycosyltransferase family 2 protein [Casimicrobiaceae bacterium]